MKQIFKLGILFLAGFIAFSSSCTKDVFTEEDAFGKQEDLELLKDSLATAQALLRDSLQKAGGIINYSVAVALGSDASWFSYFYDKGGKGGQGLDAVEVTIAQYGKVQKVTTDASGIASFKDLRIGTVNVNVRKTGYTEVDFVAVLPALLDTVYVDAYNLVRQAGTLVPVFSLTTNLSTISGVATVETDLTNDSPEPAAGVKISAVIDINDNSFLGTYVNWWPDIQFECDCEWWQFDYYGRIKQIAYHSTISEATTAANGSFSLQVPSSGDGLPIQLIPSEYAANQSLLQATLNNIPVWGVQSVRTVFGPDFTYSSIPVNGTGAGQVQSAYVTFSAPTGTPAAQPTTEATATAVLSSSGIESVSMDNQGEGYTQLPDVRFSLGTAFNPVQAEGTAVMSGGRITGVTINNPGSGYKPGDTPTVTFLETVKRTAAASAEFSFSVVDAVMGSYGSGYTSTAPNVAVVGTGTGATAHAEMTAWPTDVTMTAMGSNYTATPLVRMTDNFGAGYDLTAVMTTYNPLYSITYNGTNAQLWPSSPLPTVTITGDGAGATANATLSTTGRVTGYTALTGGSGYTTPPIVTITGGGGFGAVATASVGAGAVTGITIIDQGQGYTSIPAFTFSGGVGTGANATPVLGFPVQSITMSAGGAGYSGVTGIVLDNGTLNVNYVASCLVKYNMGVRDITIAGSGMFFTGVPAITITPRDGNGSGAAATPVITWGIKDIEIDNQGSGYLDNESDDVTIRIDPPAGFGTQATATPTLGNGVLSRVELTEYGQGYTAAPNAYVAVNTGAGGVLPLQQARLTATAAGGRVTGLTISDAGAGYDYTSYKNGRYTIVFSTYNSSAAATAKPNPKSGTIEYIQIDNPGAGYVVDPKVEINNATVDPANANGFGTGAAATATITDGRVSGITVTNPGSGYYVVPVVNITVPWSSMRAVGMCTVNADGRITGVTFPAGYPYTQGYGYDAPPAVTFTPSVTGKGTGAAGIAVVSDGSVSSVIMTNQGSGYVGKNNPNGTAKAFGFIPTSTSIQARAGKAYIRDLYLGTGKRTIEQ